MQCPTTSCARRASRRGSTFVVVALVVSTLILLSATMLVQATQNNLQLTALELRKSQMREAAFGGLRWASEAAKELPKGRATLSLRQVTVEVDFARGQAGALTVKARCSNTSGEERTLDAELRSVEGGFALTSYTFSG